MGEIEWPSVVNAVGWSIAVVISSISLAIVRRNKARQEARLEDAERHIRECDHLIHHWRGTVSDLRAELEMIRKRYRGRWPSDPPASA